MEEEMGCIGHGVHANTETLKIGYKYLQLNWNYGIQWLFKEGVMLINGQKLSGWATHLMGRIGWNMRMEKCLMVILTEQQKLDTT